jgi:hypothetical protein
MMTNYVRNFVAAVGRQLAGAQKAIQAGNCVLEPDQLAQSEECRSSVLILVSSPAALPSAGRSCEGAVLQSTYKGQPSRRTWY